MCSFGPRAFMHVDSGRRLHPQLTRTLLVPSHVSTLLAILGAPGTLRRQLKLNVASSDINRADSRCARAGRRHGGGQYGSDSMAP